MEASTDLTLPGDLSPADLREKQRAAKAQLWRRGVLSPWKFQQYPWSIAFYNFFREHEGDTCFLLAHRRSGKSTTALVVALEECYRNPNTKCAVVCKSKDQARVICDESLTALFTDCPQQFKPQRIKQEYRYIFFNGSEISILPADGMHGSKARGRKFRCIIVTEAAHIPRLRTLIAGELAPTLRDVTGGPSGSLIIESTPPDERVEEHDAEEFEDMFRKAELEGRTYVLPLSKNTLASPEFVKECVRDSGGADTVFYRREYECEFLMENEQTAVPEFTHKRAFEGDPDRQLPPIVRDYPKPSGVDRYVSLDPGGTHMTGLVFGFYDFAEDRVVIQDEITMTNFTSDELVEKVRAKEKELWGNDSSKLYRFADNNNLLLLYDLWRIHNLTFTATEKSHKFAQINKLRLMVRDGSLVIEPRCRVLIQTLRLAKFAKNELRGFKEGKEIGHADALDALLYLIRNIRRREMPQHVVLPQAVRDIVPARLKPSKSAQAFKDILTRRISGRRYI